MKGITFSIILVFISGCFASQSPVLTKEQIGNEINKIFTDFLCDKFLEPSTVFVHGQPFITPSGECLPRSFLDDQGKQVANYGREAVPYLIKWIKTDNIPVRYIAVVSLATITGIGSNIFSDKSEEKIQANIKESVERWQKWYDEQSVLVK